MILDVALFIDFAPSAHARSQSSASPHELEGDLRKALEGVLSNCAIKIFLHMVIRSKMFVNSFEKLF